MPAEHVRIPAVIDGVIDHVSVSQIQTHAHDQYGGCDAKWWYDKIGHVERPETPATKTGHETHGELEHTAKERIDSLGAIARQASPWVMYESPDVRIEHHVDAHGPDPYLIAGVPLEGYIDVLNMSPEWIDPLGDRQPMAEAFEVLDWKTVGDLSYVKPGPSLVKTYQMPLYADYVSKHLGKIGVGRLSHVSIPTKRVGNAGAAIKTTTTIDPATVRVRFAEAEQEVERMKRTARLTTVNDAVFNTESCKAFGYKGCEHQSYCPGPQKKLLLDLFGPNHVSISAQGESNMGLLDNLRAVNGTAAPATPPPAPAVPPLAAPAPAKTAAQLRAELEAMEAAEKAAPPPAPVVTKAPAAPAYTFAPSECTIAQDGTGKIMLRGNAAKAWNLATKGSPDESPTEITVATLMSGVWGIAATDASASIPAAKPRETGVVPSDGATSDPVAAADPIPAEVIPTLPESLQAPAIAHAEAAAKAEAEAPTNKRKKSTPAPAPSAPAPSPETPRPSGLGSSPSRPIIFADVSIAGKVPSDMVIDALDGYIGRVCDELCKAGKVDHLLNAPEGSAFAFGKWRGALAAMITQNPPEPGYYTINGCEGDEVKTYALAALERVGVVIRG